ncbi:MAG TPA: hypothetical protein DDW49_01095 [Deltaproteobacteria bacterium]|nr:MAG: hypothetical protein A2048_08460 [Deltaproteobacteria bacterium GWA2_45_12]HBF11978.1 hypothetical protein [Deltaproteobacteria bacterium]
MKNIKSLAFVCFLGAILVACGGGGSTGENNQIKEDGAAARADSLTVGNLVFDPSSYSKYIKVSHDKRLIILAYGFFPQGTKIDNDNHRLVFPCFEQGSQDPEVNIQLNVPPEGACNNPYLFDVSAEGESLNVNGVILPFKEDGANDHFAADFNIILTSDAVKNSITGEVISSEEGTLLSFHEKTR